MLWIALVVLLALLEFMVFGFLVGSARAAATRYPRRHPRHPVFERTFRVHYNTLEMLVVFIPSIWLFGTYSNPRWVPSSARWFSRWAALGDRLHSCAGKGELGAMLSIAALALLLVGALYGVIRALWILSS